MLWLAAAGLLVVQPTFVYSSSMPLKATVDLVALAAGLLLAVRARAAATRGGVAWRATLSASFVLIAALNQWATLGPWLVVTVSVAARRRPVAGGRLPLLAPFLAALALLP